MAPAKYLIGNLPIIYFKQLVVEFRCILHEYARSDCDRHLK